MDLNHQLVNLEDLYCSNCTNFLTPPIAILQNGKNICSKCLEQRENKEEKYIENKALENIIKHLEIPCRYASEGCKDKFYQPEMIHHEEICNFKPTICPMIDCCWTGAFKKLKNHLTTSHKDSIISSDNLDFEFVINTDLLSETRKLLHWNTEVFLLNIRVTPESITLSVSHIVNDPDDQLKCMLKELYSNNGICFKPENCREVTNYGAKTENIEINTSEFKKYGVGLLNAKIKIYSGVKPIKVDTKYMKILECPVCLELMSSCIYICENGHSICMACKEKLKECPTCKGNLGCIKNIGLQAIYEATNVFCPNRSLGCVVVLNGDDMKRHFQNCRFKQWNCIFEQEKCCFIGTYPQLISHLTEHHNIEHNEFAVKYVDESTPMEGFTENMSELHNWYKKPLIAYDHVFFLNYRILSSVLIFHLTALNKVRDMFTYEVTFGNENNILLKIEHPWKVVTFPGEIPIKYFSSNMENFLKVKFKKMYKKCRVP